MNADYQIKTDPVNLDTSDDQARPLLETAQKNLGFVPNMYQGMAIAPGMLSTYLHGYDQFRRHSDFQPAEQEVVLLTISRYNGCDYCMAAHSMIAEKVSQVPEPVLEAIRNRQPIPDPRLAALSRFVERMIDSRGLPTREDVAAFLEASFEEQHILQIVLAIAVKTLSNYGNHLNHPELDPAFAGHRWEG
ncbi:carboxymuconolactone decarboxylase family protein [Alcanivorax sp. 24]|uniref:carboxymuconolactone decarboxylase family protein n=1 Tax=Alcanivorax sp. 24 TaxID=2545266 RepID=UPI00105D4344|nr:carboxymuconolactone decarboxylase family protein [Alcanivorax sp. 24]